MIRIDAEIDLLEPVIRADQQERADEQDDAQRQLADDEHGTGGDRAARRRRARLASQRLLHPPSGRVQRGDEADQEPGQDHHGAGVGQRRVVDRDRLPHGQPLRIKREETREQRVGERDAEQASDGGEQHRLGDQLPDQASAVRPERMAHRELAPPAFALRHEQRRQVDADDQQHEQDGAAENQQRVALVADDVLVQRSGDGEVSLRVVIGIVLRPVRAQRLKLRVGLFRRNAIAQPGDHEQRMTRSIVVSSVSIRRAVQILTRSSRNPKPSGIAPITSHGASSSLIVEPTGVCSREVVTQDGDASFAPLRFVLGEGAPADGPDAEHVEESRRHRHREDALRFAVLARQVAVLKRIGGDSGKRVDAGADVGELGARQREVREVVAGGRQVARVQRDELLARPERAAAAAAQR